MADPRFDAIHTAVARELGLRDVVALPGESGACRAVARQGGVVVVKQVPDEPLATRLPQLLPVLKARGFPVADVLHFGEAEGFRFYVQALLPGNSPQRLTSELVDELVSLNECQSSLGHDLGLGESGWVQRMSDEMSLTGPWRERWSSLASSCSAGRNFVDHTQSLYSDMDPQPVPQTDVVHGDFHYGNLLTADEKLTGIIDWDGWSLGDRRRDLVSLLFSAGTVTFDQATSRRLADVLRQSLEPQLRGLYFRRDVVRAAGWFAWKHPGYDIPGWLRASERVLADLGEE